MAKYVFAQRSYWFDRLIEPGEEVEVPDGVVPGPHMKPVDEAAKAKAKASKVEYTGEVPDVLNTVLMPEYERSLAEAKAKGGTIDTVALAGAFKEALQAVLDPAARDAAFADAVNKAVSEKVASINTSIDERVSKLVNEELERVRKANAEKKAAAETKKG